MRHPTLDDVTLIRRWPKAVRLLADGGTVRGVAAEAGCGVSTVGWVRAAMLRQGWNLEARRDMTRAERIAKYPEVVACLRAGMSANTTAAECGVANATVLTVRFALLAEGEKLVAWKRIGWPSKGREP
jgi:uncharacterized protein YerC